MRSLFRSYNTIIENSYIITIPNNYISKTFSDRCAKSCDAVGMNYKIWEAYDGTQNEIIV